MQQHVTKCFILQTPYHTPSPTPTIGMGSICPNSTCSEHVHVANQIKWNHECTKMVANILPADLQFPHPPTLGISSKYKNSIFSEHGYVAYKIKWNYEILQHGSKYVACRPPTHLTLGSKGQNSTFSARVAYQIKWNYKM